MITIKRAIEIAANHLKEFYPAAEKITLEEAEVSEDDKFLLITLGYLDRDDPGANALIQALGAFDRAKKYKVFKIARDTGDVRSMKIREKENV